jgi:hypothetical protein
MFLLRIIHSDDCTYCNYEFVGVFSTEEKAEKAKKPYLRRHDLVGGGLPEWKAENWDISKIELDVPLD